MTEKTSPPEIRTTSRVRIVDQKMTLTGSDLLILMRKRQEGSGSSGGFDAETAFLRKGPEVVIADVGKSGFMPGQSRGKAAAPDGGATPPRASSSPTARCGSTWRPSRRCSGPTRRARPSSRGRRS